MRTIKLALLLKNMADSIYKRRKEKGLCVRCGKKEPIEGRAMCAECTEYHRTYEKETRIFYKSIGICPKCKKDKIYEGENLCLKCYEKTYSDKEICDKSKYDRRKYHEKWYEKSKKQGLCVRCGKGKTKAGHVYCDRCLAVRRRKEKETRKEKDPLHLERAERVSYGYCYICGDELDRKGRACTKCADRVFNNLSNVSSCEVWRRDNRIVFQKS